MAGSPAPAPRGREPRGNPRPGGDYNTATLWRVDFRGVDLREADLRQADIRQCDFREANMEHADLTDATFDTATRWPEGFDPREHGARMDR